MHMGHEPGFLTHEAHQFPILDARIQRTEAQSGQALDPLQQAPDEIADLHRIPLTDRFAGRDRGANRDLAVRDTSGAAVFSLYLPALGHDLFAPTAAIMEHFREVALTGRPTPVVRFGEPPFAQK